MNLVSNRLNETIVWLFKNLSFDADPIKVIKHYNPGMDVNQNEEQ